MALTTTGHVLMFLLPLFNLGLGSVLKSFSGLTYHIIRFCYGYSFLSLVLSYARPPFKSTIANSSISLYFALIGLTNIVVYLWYNQLSISTLVLVAAFSLFTLSVQAPVLVWAVYKIVSSARRRILYSEA